jgi:hypothetical protein
LRVTAALRREAAALLATAVWLASAAGPAGAQSEVELRAATGGYRFVDVSHTFPNHIVLDALHVGVSDVQEYHFGAGYEFGSDSAWSVTPIVYGVLGTPGRQRGVTLGVFAEFRSGSWRALAFAGRFFPTGGTVPGYSFVDAFDLTRVMGPWEVGASVDADQIGGSPAWLVGPTFKRNDGLGRWAVSWHTGEGSDFRVIRTLQF